MYSPTVSRNTSGVRDLLSLKNFYLYVLNLYDVISILFHLISSLIFALEPWLEEKQRRVNREGAQNGYM